MRILLIEDDAMIGKAVCAGLAGAGFSVDWVLDGRAAELSLSLREHALAILDLGLPRKDGMAVLDSLRAKGNSVPVLIATARDGVGDRIAGLNAGADDYVLKPFDLDELIARVRAVLRRHAGAVSPMLVAGPLVLDPVRRKVTLDGAQVALSAREFALLEYLLRNAGKVVSKTMIIEHVWGYDFDPMTNVVDVLISRLRNKLDREFESKLIQTHRGVGYALKIH